MLRKLLAILLLCVTIFTTACTATRAGQDNDGVNADDPLSYTSFIWGVIRGDLFSPVPGATPEGDAILARYQELRDTYDMTLTVEVLDSRKEDQEVTLRLNTQKDMFDLLWSDMRDIGMPFQSEGVLYALEEIETIDPTDEKWGPESYLSIGLLEGQHYGFFPNEWPFNPELEGIMIFNAELLDEYGVTLPYELWEQNAWTWSNFENILQTLKTADPDLMPWASPVYNEDSVSMFFANGLSPIVKNESTGEYEYGFDSTAGIETLDFMSRLRQAGLLGGGITGNNARSTFLDGNAAFYSSDSGEATNIDSSSLSDSGIASSNITYGIIQFPWGPNGSRETVSACYYNTTDLNFIFNMSENDSDTIGLFMEEMFAPLDGDGYLNWKERCQEIVFFDDRDYENYIFMIEHAKYDMSGFYTESSSTLDGLYKKVVAGEMAASSAFEEVRQKINAEINKNMR